MARRIPIDKLIEMEQAKQDALRNRVSELKRQKIKEDKAEREKKVRAIGRLAFKCGIGEMDLGELEVAFKQLTAGSDPAYHVPENHV